MSSCESWRFRVAALVVSFLFAAAGARSERPRVYALTNAKILVAPGRIISKGTVVLRDGLVEAVGADVAVPPDAVEIDASGKTIYPGLVDSLTALGLPRAPETPAPGAAGAAALPGFGQRRETPPGAIHPLSRVRPETRARNLIVPFEGDTTDAQRYRSMGITTVLVAPTGGVFRGESALINLKDSVPTRELILKDRVAQHVSFEHGGFGRDYPSSLMGAVATIRQVLLDADRYLVWEKRYAAHPAGMKHPESSSAFEALASVLDRSRPVIFEAGETEDVLLADRLAREFNLNAVIAGSGNEWESLDQVKATGRTLIVPVIPQEKPKVEDADEALDVTSRELRRYVYAPENPKRLHEAGVRFALTTHRLKNPADFAKNMRMAIAAGLPPDVALAALTTVPAEIFGVAEMLGTLEPGKIANLILTNGELFGEKTKVERVFVDGYEYKVEERRPRGNPAAVVDPRGTWSVVLEYPGGRTANRVWTIRGTRGNYSGTAETRRGTVAFSDVQLEGDALTVTLPDTGGGGGLEITVIIRGDSFEGSAEQGRVAIHVRGTRTSGPEGGSL